jgi:RNA polymerase sigma factor (sigma-70 family)
MPPFHSSAPPPAEPAQEPGLPAPPPEGPTPRKLSIRERDAIVARLCKEHGTFLRDLLRRQAGILPESTKDLYQKVLLALTSYVEKHGAAPERERPYLRAVVKNVARNHRRVPRPRIQEGADADAHMSPDPDPERAAELDEQRRKLERYLDKLPRPYAQVVRCLDLLGMGFDEAALALRRPRSTIVDQHEAAWNKLQELAAASENATLLGARRLPAK